MAAIIKKANPRNTIGQKSKRSELGGRKMQSIDNKLISIKDELQEEEDFWEDEELQEDENLWDDEDLEEDEALLDNENLIEYDEQEDTQTKCILDNNLNKELIELDLTEIAPAQSQSSSKGKLEAGFLSIINGNKCGYSVTISKEVCNKLNLKEHVQIGFLGHYIVLGLSIPNQESTFNLKDKGEKKVIYSADLVREITDRLGLVFSQGNKTCITFYELVIKEIGGNTVVLISR